jgi:quercetin 2,3-dioxygenase
MITLCRANDREHDRRNERDGWLTSCPGDSLSLDDDRLAPGAHFPPLARWDAETVTYVHEGTLAFEDSTGHSGVIHAGEFQCMTVRRGGRHAERNASRSASVHVFRLWLRPAEAKLEPGHEEKRFSAAQRRGGLCVIASADARRGSLRIHQDAVVFSALLDPGQHVVHEISQGRSSWLHLVQGEVMLGDQILTTGDGAAVTAARAVSFTAREQTEILMLDVGARA